MILDELSCFSQQNLSSQSLYDITAVLALDRTPNLSFHLYLAGVLMTKVVLRNVQSKLTCIYPIRFRALAHEADLFSSDAGSSTLVTDEIYVFLKKLVWS